MKWTAKAKRMFGTIVIGACLLAAAGCGSGSERAGGDVGNYPNKPINLIVTHGAGGDTDYNARLLARLLEKELGQSVVPNNVTGANGSIALEQYKDGNPDGYTIIATNSMALVANKATGLSDFSYESFEPVAIYGKQSGENIVVRADAPYKTIEDLVNASKAAPNTIKYGVSMGGGVYVVSVVFDKIVGAKFNVVDIGDASNRLTSLLGGHVDVTSLPYATAREYIESGQLRTLGTCLSSRSQMLPDIPSISESYKDVSADTLYVVLAPKGTDPAIVEKLNQTIHKIVKENPEYKAECEKMNYQAPWALSVEETKAELEKQLDHYMKYSQYLQ